MLNDDIEYTHDPLFGTPIDQGARCVPGPSTPSIEKPYQAIDRACRDLARVARELRESAAVLGLDLSEKDIRTAIYKRIAKALGD